MILFAIEITIVTKIKYNKSNYNQTFSEMKKLFLGTIFTCTIALCGTLNYLQKETPTSLDVLSLQNIEALAYGEGMGLYACYGRGSVDCPNGTKVEIYANNLSLD